MKNKETLEEAFSNYINERHSPIKSSNPDLASAKFGAKWKAERMYSEEEVTDLLQKALIHKDDGEIGALVTAQGEIRTANFNQWVDKYVKRNKKL
jgi:hypothetical protein